jgi:hypothetical protein
MSPYSLLIDLDTAQSLVRMDSPTLERSMAALFALRESPWAGQELWNEHPVSGWVTDLDPRADPCMMIFYTVDERTRTLSVTALTWRGNWPA